MNASALAANKAVVIRLIREVMTGGNLDLLTELFVPERATAAREWIAPFRESFPDVRMEIVDLVAEDDQVVGRFRCSATQQRAWQGHEPTGRRFQDIDEISIFRFRDGRIVDTWALEDNLERLTQLGLLSPSPRPW